MEEVRNIDSIAISKFKLQSSNEIDDGRWKVEGGLTTFHSLLPNS